MVRQDKEASYAAKAESKVNYPKLKSKDKKAAQSAAAGGTGRGGGKGIGDGGTSRGGDGGESLQLPDIRRLSATMPKVYPTDSDEPSIELLVDILHNNTVFDAAENRRELEKILTRFIAEKTVENS